MRFSEIAERLTGISCPVFGLSWNPPESERTIAQRILVFLEDRRVLYNPSEMEIPEHCVQSVIDIRKYLTSELQNISTKSKLNEPVRAMRAACRKFLDKINSNDNRFLYHARHWGDWASWNFIYGLGEMRGTFGVMVAQLAVSYGIDIIEEGLSSIIPEKDTD